jgi:hypothetical protein
MSEWGLRIRAVLSSHGQTLVVVFLLLGIAGGWMTYSTVFAPGTETTEQVANSWTYGQSFEHEATVATENDVYPVGRTLENRSTYFRSITPELAGTHVTKYTGEQGNVTATVTLSLVLRGVDGGSRTADASVIWATNRQLDRRVVTGLSPGERVTSSFTIDVDAVTNETARIREQLGSNTGEREVLVRAVTEFEGQVNGDRVDRTSNATLAIEPQGSTYEVSETGSDRETVTQTAQIEVERSYGFLRTALGPILLVGGFGGAGGLALARRKNLVELSNAELDRLSYLDDREQFDEWISQIALPAAAFDLPEAEAASLGALVDFAIDTDNGVVESPDEAAFYVVHDGYLYTYRPPVLDEELDSGSPGEEPTFDAGEETGSFDLSFLDGDDPSDDDLPSGGVSQADED